MTEAEWLACVDPMPMLEFLRGKASDRKLRLFACACCHRVGNHLWSGSIGQEAILTAEKYADGMATLEELDACRRLIESQLKLYPSEPVYDASYWACGRNIQEKVEGSAFYAANRSTWSIDQSADDYDARCEKRRNEELAAQASFLHNIFGPLPFHFVHLEPSWLTWNDGTIPKLAQAIYEERAFDHLPILADALEEAGCTNEDILGHCRSGGEHVRGCWVVDSLLGKS